MKLLNHTLKYLVLLLPVIIAIWAGLFYYNMVDEVEDSLDDGLANYKMLIIEQALRDTSILHNAEFNERNYAIRPVDAIGALAMTDQYLDTMMYMVSEEDFEPVRMLKTAFKQQDKYYELRVISSSLEKDDLVEDLLFSIIWLYVVLIASVLIINNFVLRRIWTPFYQLLDKIGKFNLEKNPVITPTPSKVSEFQELDHRLVQLANQSAATYASQKQFLENAAHELQTPLAISINQLELLAEHKDVPPQYVEAIGTVTRNLRRLSRLNKALLLLTKIENRQFEINEEIEINQVIKRLLDQYEDVITSRQIEVELEEAIKLRWKMNADLAEILISNLLKNAWVHNQSGGVIRIVVGADQLVIANTAVSGALDTDRIFERFRKDSPDIQRVGLGLAIVKAIGMVSGLRIDYRFAGGMHYFSVIQIVSGFGP